MLVCVFSSSFFLVLAFVLPFRLPVSRACFVDLFFFGLFRFGFLWLFLFSSCACVVLKEGRGLFVPVLLSTRSCREARVCCWVSCCCFVAKWLPGLALSFRHSLFLPVLLSKIQCGAAFCCCCVAAWHVIWLLWFCICLYGQNFRPSALS